MKAVVLVFYALVALLTLRVLLPILLRLFAPSLSIGRLSPLGLGDIAWTSQLGGSAPQERIQVHVGRVGWSCWGSKTCSKGWFVLKLTGVRVIIPRAALLAPPGGASPKKRAAPPPTDSPVDPKPIEGTFARLLHLLRSRLVSPALDRLSAVVSALSSALVLFAVQVDFSVEMEGTLMAIGVLSAGVEVGGHLGASKSSSSPSHDLRETRLGGWLALGNVEIFEAHPSPSPNAPSTTSSPPLPALAMRERLVVSLSAPLGLAGGFAALVSSKGRSFRAEEASLRASITFGEGQAGDGEGVHVRIHELKRIVTKAEGVGRERARMLEEHRAEIDKKEDTSQEHPPLKKMSPIHCLRSVDLSLPLFVLSAHYHTPLHILAASPKRPLPQSVAFAWTVKNMQGKLTLGGTTQEVAKQHSQFLGKDREMGLGVRLSWEEIEGRVKVNGSEEDILPSSAKAFSLGASAIHITSTWLPPFLVKCSTHTSTSIPPRDFNDETIVIEGMIGEMRGHTTFETLDSALRIFKARPRPELQPRSTKPKKPLALRALPRVVGTLASAGIELRIQAPLNSELRDAEEDDHFFRSWSSPELFCISFPNGAVSFASEYTDRSVRRNEVDRRVAKRMAKQSERARKTEEVTKADDESPQSPTAELEKALGVPPPPPISSPPRRHLPLRPDASLSKHLDTHSLRYSTHAHLTADMLNIYILATNHGSTSADDAAGWLDEKPTLPSDPIRLDILAIGPVEITTTQTVNGMEEATPLGPVAVLDAETHTGEINLLVEEIGIDLWRPLVMGSLSDFLSSFASASATSTLRTPSSYHKPPSEPPKPLVEILPPEQCIYVAVASFDLRIAGSDPKNDEHACRGVAVHSGPLIFEYLLQKSLRSGAVNYADRQQLEMREDIRVEANANVAEKDGARQALIKFSLNDFHLDPVVDARASRGHTRKYSSVGGDGELDEEDWELKNRAQISDLVKRRRSIMPVRVKEEVKGIVGIPHIAIRVRLGAATVVAEEGESAPLDEVTVSIEGETINLRVELFTIYLCLVAISALRSLSPKSSVSPHTRPPPETPASLRRPPPLVSLRLEIADVNLFPTLPHNVHLFGHIRRLRIQHSKKIGLLAEWDMLLLAGECPTAAGKWDDIIRLRVTTLAIRPEPDNDGYKPFVVVLSSESARLRIPFRYVFSRIVDNTANLIKAVKQLIHQHVKGGLDFIIEPCIEEAKRLPKIEINVRMFAIEIQDDPFETRLNIIWRAGYEEQSARIERDAAFEAKVEAIKRAEAADGAESEEEEEEGRPSSRQPKVSGKHTVGIEEARRDLRAYNSSHWVKRMRNAVAEQGRREEALTRRLYGAKHNSQRPDSLLPVDLLPASRSAPLARATLQDLHFTISRPSFADEHLPDFMHDVGKGLPHDTQFSLLVPLHFSWKMDGVLVQLRDYPLPLLNIPAMPQNGDHDFSSWECEADLVIGEEMGGPESVRRVPTEVVPAHASKNGRGELYSIVVPRSAMPVKTYCIPTVKIRTPYATRIGWGNSVAPAIQDVAKVLDTLSKASPDPSERIGFWDKIRLQFHWRVKVLFVGDGSVHFHLKGARDPYALTGFGAGFAKSWHGNVRFLIGLDNVDREVIQIISDTYILGIPNLRDYVDNAATGMTSRDPNSFDANDAATQHSNTTGDPMGRSRAVGYEFTKVCAKFINGVRWGMGMVLERACLPDCTKASCRGATAFHRQCRFFEEFRPHWDVHTKTADAIGPEGEIDDSFAGFRSDFIHFSLSLTSPLTLPLPSHNSSPVEACDYDGHKGYNSMHFSAHANTHFARWWKLFDSTMSLPIRQGKLFPSAQAPSKKFGKHCATIKYRFSLAPLFISHTYRQDTWSEWSKGETTVLGVKGKIGRFNVDLHQREQEETVVNPDTGVKKTLMRKAFYMAEVDCDGVDLRAITACFKEPEKAVVVPDDLDDGGDDGEEIPSMQDYTIADEDLDWVDMDDFNDAVYTIPEQTPRLRVLPFIVCPRFTYYRQIDAAGKSAADEPEEDSETSPVEHPKAKTKFGSEPSHTCLMGCATDTVTVQLESAEARLAELERELRRSSDDLKDGARKEIELRIRAIRRIIERLIQVRDGLDRATHEDGTEDTSAYDAKAPKPDPPYGEAPHAPAADSETGPDAHLPHITSTLYQQWGEWENRYMVHNPTIQITNVTREVLLKYYYSSTDRRGFVYYLSASAIKYISDLAKEHEKKHRRNWSRRKSMRTGSSRRTAAFEETQETNRLLDELIDRGEGGFWAANESADEGRHSFGDALDVDPDNAADHLPEHFDLNSGHLCMFIKPQISLHSDVDDKSTVILTAFRAQLKVFSVVDARIQDDPVNADVCHQTFASLDGLQAFYPHQSGIGSGLKTAFVPLETLVDLRVEPWGFDRVVPRTSAALRYDKFNQLRLSSKNFDSGGLDSHGPQTSHFHTGTDRVSVECDKFSVSANPDHFAAIYNVVTDLLLYSDPARKSRNSKLEAVVFTHDFSDLLGIANIIKDLQQRIRAQLILQQLYQVHLDELDDEGRIELFVSRSETSRLGQELSLVVDAITQAQNMNGASKMSGTTAGVQFEARASELVYHMLDRADTPFVKFSVNGVEFSWISKQDSSVSNRLVIKDLKALNSSPEHVFAEIISKNEGVADHELCKVDVFAALLWNALPSVGGISIVEQFEVHLHPIRLQLEHRVGRQILDYLFVQRRKQNEEEQDDDSDDKKAKKPLPSSSPSLRPPSVIFPDNKSVESLSLRTNHRPRSMLGAEDRSLTPNRSMTNLPSSASIGSNEHRLRKVASTEVLAPAAQEEGLDADEMRLRASLNKTFLLVDFTSTVLCLTYRSEKDDHSRLPDIYNITYKTPSIQYRSKTWSFLDLLNELKKDTIKSVWSQKGALLGQLLQTAHRRLPLTDARAAAKKSFKTSLRTRLNLKSPSSSRSNSALELPKSSPLARNPSSSDKGTPSNTPPSRPSPQREPSPNSSSSDLSDDEIVGDGPIGLPFDVNTTHLLDSEEQFVQEPEEMSIRSDIADASSGSRSAQESEREKELAEHHSAPLGSIKKLSAPPSSKHAASLPPPPERSNSIDHVGYPMHQPTRGSMSLANHSEESKARLLMGKSFE